MRFPLTSPISASTAGKKGSSRIECAPTQSSYHSAMSSYVLMVTLSLSGSGLRAAHSLTPGFRDLERAQMLLLSTRNSCADPQRLTESAHAPLQHPGPPRVRGARYEGEEYRPH